MVSVRPVEGKKDRKAFIKLPYKIYKGDPYWVAPLEMDIRNRLSRKHPFFEFGDMELFLAEKNGEVVGRIAAITNDRYNEHHPGKTGFFGFFESINDQEVADALFEKVCIRLKEKGLVKLHGPASPSSNYDYGLLVEGFDDEPRIMMTYNPPYYIDLIENVGLEKAKGLLAFKLNNQTVNQNEKLHRVAKIAQERVGMKVRNFNVKNLRSEVDIFKEIYNQAWEVNWGHVPFTEAEIDLMAKEMKPVIQPELALFGEVDGEVMGMALALPDFNFIIKQMNGKILPFNWIKFFTQRKKIKWLRVILLGVLPQYQRKGLDAVFYLQLIQAAEKLNIELGEASWILEDNKMMKRGVEVVNGEVYKKYNVYEMPI